MTPAAIIALVRDVVILVALAALIYLLITYGKDVVKVADMKAVQQQLTANAQTQAQWAAEARDADLKRSQDLDKVTGAISAQRAPVFVRSGPASACPVSQPAAQAASRPPAAGGDEPGAGEDLRPALNAYEVRLETVIADCRNALEKWP